MNLNFKPVEAEDLEELNPFFCKRPNKTCDSVFLDSFIWREYYNVRYAVSDNKAILWLMDLDGKTGSAMPICSEEDLEYYFWKLVEYFNTELKAPLYINLADEEAVEQLGLKNMPDKFKITEQVDLKDYLYDGNAMRTLSGKKLHKKKNHLNAFKREYEGRYEYRRLCCSDRGDVWKFLDRWREEKGEEVEEHLDYEVRGIHEILKNCSLLNVRIHIEKANPEIRGLYQFINQQFLIEEFPEAVLINREDDLGLEGLRKAKLSYNPIDYARKYQVEQIW